MKAIKKLALVLAALATVFAFASCSDDDDDDDDGPAVVTTWAKTESGTDEGTSYNDTVTIYFYEDGTFKIVNSGNYGNEYSYSDTEATGTYTGDTTQASATIEAKVTKIAKYMISDKEEESTELVENTSDDYKNLKAKISSDGKTLTLNYETYTKQ